MSESALQKLVSVFKTPQHDYKVSTELFGQFDPNKVAKELKLEKIGAEKGEKNQPSASSQISDEIEVQIQERIESAKSHAHELAENQIQTYVERISNLDFEGHFSELRQAGPMAISDIQSQVHLGLNDMNTRRRKLKDIENEYSHFRNKNGLQNRTAKITTPIGSFLKILLILILIIFETYVNGTYLAKGSTQGLLGGVVEAFSFAILNIGFSIILTHFLVKQIVRPQFFWKLIGLIGVCAWLAVVTGINLGLAHYREIAATIMDGAGALVLESIINDPLALKDLESWILFSIGSLFATITLVDILTFSDVFPGYTKLQLKWDDHQEEYKEEFEHSMSDLEEIKENYYETLRKIGDDLSARQRELDKILAGRNKLSSLYASHHEQLQRSASALFSIYYEANKASRTEPVPERFNKGYLVSKMTLSSQGTYEPREAQNIKKRIKDAKDFLDQQMEKVHEEVSNGIEKYNNLDKLELDQVNGEKQASETQ